MKPALRTITLDHANDVLERADKLDDAVSNLRAFRSLLEDLNARTSIDLPPLDLPPQQVRAIEMVRLVSFDLQLLSSWRYLIPRGATVRALVKL
jgi:hypothetical protein